MATVRLAVSPRAESGKGFARSLRRDGRVPAVIYGRQRGSLPISVNTRELERLLGQISPAATVIELQIEGADSARTLIREIQRHPFKRNILHVDFQEVVAGERITVKVPIICNGVPEGVRLGGGMLDQLLYEVEVEADPSSIPGHFDVDVSAMLVGQVIHLSDIAMPDGVSVVEDGSIPVCVVQAPRVSEATDEDAAGSEPEVIGRVKDASEAE